MRGRRWWMSMLVGFAAVAALPATAAAQAIEVGHTPACVEAVPSAVSLPTGDPIDVHVHVVLDAGVSLEQGRALMEQAARAYEPLGMRLVLSYTTATMSSDDTAVLIRQLKLLFGGSRPPWAHLVYLLTPRDLGDSNSGKVPSGQASCIGGVAFADNAFAMGEVGSGEVPFGSLRMHVSEGAKTAAHEIGHLFGGQHQYANCHDAAADGEEPTDVSPCTVMWPEITLPSLIFSALNASIVRGHAVTYVEPVTAAPPPDGSPSIPPQMSGCELRAYRDVPGDHVQWSRTNPSEADLLAGTFRTLSPDMVRFTWKVASIDGDLSPALAVRYQLNIESPRRLLVDVRWNGADPPTGQILEGGSPVAELHPAITPGDGGVVSIDLPLAALGLAGRPLGLGLLVTSVEPDDRFSDDDAEPTVETFVPQNCTVDGAPVPVPATGPVDPAPPAAAPGSVRLHVPQTSARRLNRARRLPVRLSGTLRDVRLRLVDHRGRTLGAARRKHIEGTALIRLRLKRRLRAGDLELRLSAAGGLKHREPLEIRR